VGLASRASLRYRQVAVPQLAPPTLFALLASLALASAGCDARARADTPDAAPPPPASASVARPPPAPPSASAAAEKGELSLLKLVFTSEVKSKEPADVLKSATPGQRVWAHLTVRNRGPAPRTLTLVFKVNGKERSRVDLKVVPSWSFRTWGYTTLRAEDLGGLTLEVVDDSGATFATGALPIRAADEAKPQKHAPLPLDE